MELCTNISASYEKTAIPLSHSILKPFPLPDSEFQPQVETSAVQLSQNNKVAPKWVPKPQEGSMRVLHYEAIDAEDDGLARTG